MPVPDLTLRPHEVLWVPARNLWRWSDEVWHLHGYAAPEAELTRELAIAHAKHSDHPRIFEVWARLLNGEHVTFLHDVVTVQARQKPSYMGLRTVSGPGEERVVKGVMFDLTPASADAEPTEDRVLNEAGELLSTAEGLTVPTGLALLDRYSDYLAITPDELARHLLNRAGQRSALDVDSLDPMLVDAASQLKG